MPTYGIMHDDGTFEPLQQGGQNYGSRPMNLPPGVYWDAQRKVFTNTTPVSSIPGGRVQRYTGNGYAPRQMNLPQGIYWDAQRRVFTNTTPVTAIQGGRVQRYTSNGYAPRPVNLPPGVYWDAQRRVFTNTTPVSSAPGGRVQRGNVPQNITQQAKSAPSRNFYDPNVNYFADWGQGYPQNVPRNITQTAKRLVNNPNIPNITDQAKFFQPDFVEMSPYYELNPYDTGYYVPESAAPVNVAAPSYTLPQIQVPQIQLSQVSPPQMAPADDPIKKAYHRVFGDDLTNINTERFYGWLGREVQDPKKIRDILSGEVKLDQDVLDSFKYTPGERFLRAFTLGRMEDSDVIE